MADVGDNIESNEVKQDLAEVDSATCEVKKASEKETPVEAVKSAEEKSTDNGEKKKSDENTTASIAATEKTNGSSETMEAETNGSSDPVEVTPELLTKIRKQVEFYFGDVNMQRDKFLIEQTKLDEGWVPMTVMLNFKILASLSKDIEVILKALDGSEWIEISEDRKKIRRSKNKPLPVYDEEFRKAQEERTVYMKGFPQNSTMEQLKAHFESNDNVENIIMRKYKKGKEHFFKGSIFLQFKTLDAAKAFMEQESVKFNDVELLKMWSNDYGKLKEQEKEERRQKKAENKKTQEENQQKNAKNDAPNKCNLPKGCVIHITKMEKTLKREPIKEKLIELEADVAYIDYSPGDEEGWVRFHGENSAVNLMKKLEADTLKVGSCEITCRLIEGEEEETYFAKVQEDLNNIRNNRRHKGHGGRRGFKRRHSPSRETSAKKIALE